VKDLKRARTLATVFAVAAAWEAPVPVIVTGAETVVFANAAAFRLLSHSEPSAIIGAPLETVIPTDAVAAEQLRRDLTAETGRPLIQVPTRLVTGDGRIVQPLADLIPISTSDGALQLFAFAAETPNARVSALPVPELGPDADELALAVLEALPVSVMLQDEKTILFANATARSYLRAVDKEQLEGAPITSILHSDGVFSAIERMGFFFATHQKISRVPVKLRALDGHIFHVEADAYPLHVGEQRAALLLGRFVR
jgi:hypothetical protein